MSRFCLRPVVTWFLSVLALTAAAGAAQPPLAVASPEVPEASADMPPPLPPGSDTYLLGPGDVIKVVVWRYPELSVESVPVLPDGRVSTPLVDAIVATSKTPVQLARDIEAALTEYVRSPQVSVLVVQPLSTFSQIRVVGQVVRPQAVAFTDGMTAMDAVLAAGGMTTFARGNGAKIVRKVNGKDTEIRVRLRDVMEKGELKHNVLLLPGDVLVIPESFF